jgi:hypothetical protein
MAAGDELQVGRVCGSGFVDRRLEPALCHVPALALLRRPLDLDRLGLQQQQQVLEVLRVFQVIPGPGLARLSRFQSGSSICFIS